MQVTVSLKIDQEAPAHLSEKESLIQKGRTSRAQSATLQRVLLQSEEQQAMGNMLTSAHQRTKVGGNSV